MNFNTLRRRVRRAEAVVQVRMDDTARHWGALEAVWRRSWTPGRIVIAGLAGGFVAGKLEPGRAFSGARWLQMIGSVSGLVASAQASVVAFQEAAMAAAAQAHGSDNGSTAPEPPVQRREPAPATPRSSPPQAAEAATELSEP